MTFLITLVCAAVLAGLLKPAIKKVPAVWYAIAAVLVVLYLWCFYGDVPRVLHDAVFAMIQKGTLPTAMFTVVMFIGVLPRGSWLRRRYAPIRAELSIMACILIIGHVLAYGISYFPRLFGGSALRDTVVVGLIFAIILVVLLVVLGVTSLQIVKNHMSAHTWSRIQKSSYVFYALMFAHMIAMLLPSALSGSATDLQSVIIYAVVFGAYLVLRIIRAVLDHRHAKLDGGGNAGDGNAGDADGPDAIIGDSADTGAGAEDLIDAAVGVADADVAPSD